MEATGSAGPTLLDEVFTRIDGDRRPRVAVFDAPEHLLASDPGAGAALAHLWARVRARSLPLHLVLLSEAPDRLATWISGDDAPLAPTDEVEARPLDAWQLRESLPGWSPRDRLLVWCALGGSPDRLRHVEGEDGLAGNVIRLVLDPSGPLHRLPVADASARLRKPERYLGVLGALARGARDWGEIRTALPEVAAGARLAPYLTTLEELGWVETERSLDAGPDSRRRRYRLTDPFTGFWLRAVAPRQGRLHLTAPARLWNDEVAPELDAWARHLLPWAVRRSLEGRPPPPLGVPARRTGGIWGEDRDLPIAGILRNGASFYGVCAWGRGATIDDARALARQMRRTRFGFGREARLRLLVGDGVASDALARHVAREPYLRILGLGDLF
jgi:hypothetical protein